jgi:hypothetical protein
MAFNSYGNITKKGGVLAHKTSFTLPLFIAPNQESELSSVCVLVVSILLAYDFDI